MMVPEESCTPAQNPVEATSGTLLPICDVGTACSASLGEGWCVRTHHLEGNEFAMGNLVSAFRFDIDLCGRSATSETCFPHHLPSVAFPLQ